MELFAGFGGLQSLPVAEAAPLSRLPERVYLTALEAEGEVVRVLEGHEEKSTQRVEFV